MPGGWEDYLESLGIFGMRPGLERVSVLLAALEHPERDYCCIHVVGTNGKSSTTRYAEALLHAHGLRSGAYLSPHISGFCERVIVCGQHVSEEAFGAAVERVREQTERLPEELGAATQFEVLTVAAFVVLSGAGVRVAAIEAGLGGRLDATNVLAAPVTVLTGVALDHTEVLGDTREAIFAEKAAVIRGGEAVFGPLEGLEGLADEWCARVGARPHHYGRQLVVDGGPEGFSVRLRDHLGRRTYARLCVPTAAAYQVTNAALAVTAADLLLGGLSEERARIALAGTAVPGRLQVVCRRPLVLADGAHNPDGVRALLHSLRSAERPRPRVGLIAVMRDKAVEDMLRLLAPEVDVLVCTQASEPRSIAAKTLAAQARAVTEGGLPTVRVEAVSDPQAAYRAALAAAGPSGSVLVTGSLYLLEDLAEVVSGGSV